MPLGYNGRASSVIIDGQSVRRPRGFVRPSPSSPTCCFMLTQQMDFELEMGIFISKPIPMGQSIMAEEAEDYIFGLVLLNDWSARDVQFAEMAPLGPFHGKSSATSISPWVVTLDALHGATCSSSVTPWPGEPALAAHLHPGTSGGTWDIEVEVTVRSKLSHFMIYNTRVRS